MKVVNLVSPILGKNTEEVADLPHWHHVIRAALTHRSNIKINSTKAVI